MSLSKGSSRLSPFFSVHINPPNEAVSSLLENQIKQLMNRLIASQKSNASEQGEVSGVASSLEQGEAGADDAVVKHIASILIKVIKHWRVRRRCSSDLATIVASVVCSCVTMYMRVVCYASFVLETLT